MGRLVTIGAATAPKSFQTEDRQQQDALTAALLSSVGLTAPRPRDNDFAARAWDSQRKYAALTAATPTTDPIEAERFTLRRTKAKTVAAGAGRGGAVSTREIEVPTLAGRLNSMTVGALENTASGLFNAAGMAGRLLGAENAGAGLERAADAAAADAGGQIAFAKEGTGEVGGFLVDAGVAGTQLLADASTAALTGGSALVPMFIRSFGGGAQEARQAGGSLGEQAAYGVLSGVTEVATEKISNVAAPFRAAFGGGVLDGAIEKAVGKLGKSALGKALLTAMAAAGGEGVEELISDALNPLWKGLTFERGDAGAAQSVRDAYGRDFDLSEAVYDALVGGALGLVGAGGQIVEGAAEGARAGREAGASAAIDGAYDAMGRQGLFSQEARDAAAYALERGAALDRRNVAPAAPGAQTAGGDGTITPDAQRGAEGVLGTQNAVQMGNPTRPAVWGEGGRTERADIPRLRGMEQSAVSPDAGAAVRADTSLFDRGILRNFNQARQYLIDFAKTHFPQSVVNSETGKTIGISRNGLDKFLSGNILYEKYATGFHIPELIENAHKVAFAENYHPETTGSIPTFEYYDSPVEVDGKEYNAHIRIKNTNVGDKYYGHTISEVDDIKIEPPTRVPSSETLTGQPEKTGGSIEPSARTSAEAVQPVYALDGPVEGIRPLGDEGISQLLSSGVQFPEAMADDILDKNSIPLEEAESKRDILSEILFRGKRTGMEAEARQLFGRSGADPLQTDMADSTMGETTEEGSTDGPAARAESREAFYRRGAGEGGEGVYQIIEGRNGAFGYRPVQRRPQAAAEQIQKALQSLGVSCAVTDGTVLWNKDGFTGQSVHNQAVTVDGKIVLISDNADIPPLQAAGHEAFHFWKNTSARQQYVDTLQENILYASEEFLHYQNILVEDYFGGDVDLGDAKKQAKFLEELFAYLSGDIHEGTNDEFLRPMFRDYDAVKAAWNRLVRESGAREAPGGDGLGAAGAGELGAFTQMQNKAETFHPVNPQAAENGEQMRGRAPEEVPDVNPRTGRPVSKTVSTILNSPLTSNEMALEIEGAVADGRFDFVSVTDRDTHIRAQRNLSREGLQAVAARFITKAELGQRITKADMAEGIAAYNQAVESGDHVTAFQLMGSIAGAAHDSAQTVQAMNLMNRLTPEGRLLTLRRYVDRLNDRTSTRQSRPAASSEVDVDAARADYVEKTTGFTISDELASAYLLAETDAERAAAWDAITTDLARQIPSTFREKADFWRYTSMLLNPTTHVRNIFGNLIQAGARKIKNGVGAALERAVVRDQGQRTKSLLDPLNEADKALKEYAGTQYEKDRGAAMGSGKYSDASSAGIGREIQEKRRMFQGENPFSRAVQGIGDFNTRWLDREDVWFNRPAYVESFAQALKAKGVTAAEAASGANAAAVDAARAYAIQEAQKATYRNTTALSEALSKAGRYQGENPVLKGASFAMDALMPFRRTPANILTTGLDYSPLGLAKGMKEALLDVRRGSCTAADAVDSLAAGLTGTGILALGAYLAAEGLLHVRIGDDDREEDFNKAAGMQEYALQIGDKSYTMDWALPAAMPLFAGAAIVESAAEGGSTLEAVLDAMTGISEVVLETSMLSSLNDLISNWSYADNKITYLLDRTLSSYAGQYVPTIGGKIASAADETVRKSYVEKGTGQVASDADYFLQSILKKVPGARNTLQPAIDLWGNEVSGGSAGERMFQSFLSPGYLKTVDSDPVNRELRRLAEATGSSAVYPAQADKSFAVDGEPKYLTAEEYTKYAKALGKTRYDAVKALLDNAGYKKLSDEEKAKAIANAYEYANVIGKQAVSAYRPGDSSFAKGAMSSVLPIDSYILYKINADRDRSGGVTSVESAETLRELTGLTDRQRGEAWRQKNSTTNQDKNPFIGSLPAAGVDVKTAIGILDRYRTLSNTDGMKPKEKAAAFKQYVKGLGLTREQTQAVEEIYTFFGSYPVKW